MNTLDEIDKIVEEYKSNTSQEALSKLIDAFNAYLIKWVNVIKCYHINLGDPEIATFVGLFNCGDIMELKRILTNTFKEYDSEELYHELLLLFIYTVLKYRKMDGKYFPGYLKGSFKYRVYRWIHDKMNEMPSSYSMVNDLKDHSTTHCDTDSSVDYDILLDTDVLPCLTSKEKMILYLRYVDDRSIDDIAKIYECTSGHINRVISNAKKKLSEDILREGS